MQICYFRLNNRHILCEERIKTYNGHVRKTKLLICLDSAEYSPILFDLIDQLNTFTFIHTFIYSFVLHREEFTNHNCIGIYFPVSLE